MTSEALVGTQLAMSEASGRSGGHRFHLRITPLEAAKFRQTILSCFGISV